MRVAFSVQGIIRDGDLVADPFNPVAWTRLVLPGRALQAAGHEAVLALNLAQRPSGELIAVGDPGMDGIDVVVVTAWMNDDAADAVRRARSTGQLVIADVADWMWSGVNVPGTRVSDQWTRDHPRQNREHEKAVIRAASAVTVSTPWLAERIGRWNEHTYSVRNMVDVAMWDLGHNTATSGRKPLIGWYGETHFRTRRDDLTALRGVLGPFLIRHGLPFAHVGDHPANPAASELLGLDPTTDVRVHPQAAMIDFPQAIRSAAIDVGLVPLADNTFNAGKSALKGMEMAAAGIPYVAQAHPEYEWFDAGLVVRRPQEWKAALERLLDPDERSRLARAGRERVAREDWHIRGHEWADLLDDLTGVDRPTRATR